MKLFAFSTLALISAFCHSQTFTYTSTANLTQSFTTTNSIKTGSATKNWSMAFTGIDPTQYTIVSATIQLFATGKWVNQVFSLGSTATGADTGAANSKLFSPAQTVSANTSESYLNVWTINTNFGTTTATVFDSDLSPVVSIPTGELASLYGTTINLPGNTNFSVSHTQFTGLNNTTSTHAFNEDLSGILKVTVVPVPEPGVIAGLSLGLIALVKRRRKN